MWNYGFQWTTKVIQQTSIQTGGLRVVYPLQAVKSYTLDISEYLDFGFYDHVSYKYNYRLVVTYIGSVIICLVYEGLYV